MSALIFVLIGMGILITAFLFSNLRLAAKIKFDYETNNFHLTFRLFGGLIRYRTDFSLVASETGKISVVSPGAQKTALHHARLNEILYAMTNSYYRHLKNEDQFRKLFTRIIIQDLKIDAVIGLADAAQTALVLGSVMSVFGPLIRHIKRKPGFRKCQIQLKPYFGGLKFDMAIDCIIIIRLGHIIIIGIKILLQNIKGGVMNGRASYRKYNDDHYGKY